MIASLDGITYDLNESAEYKCGKSAYDKAKSVVIPDYYIPQLMHQMAVTGHESMTYGCFWCDDFISITCNRDNEYIELLIEKEKEFYDCLINLREPVVESIYELIDDENSVNLAKEFSDIKAEISKLDRLLKDKQKDLIAIANGRNIKVGELKVRKKVRVGNVQYKNIPELANVDLNKYRSKTTEFYSIL